MSSVEYIEQLVDDIKHITPDGSPEGNRMAIQLFLYECQTDYPDHDAETTVLRGIGSAAGVIVRMHDKAAAESLINLFVVQSEDLFDQRTHSKSGFINVSPVPDFLDRSIGLMRKSYGLV